MKRYATKINIIQSPSAAKRKGEEYGVIRVQTHKGIYIVSGESIHCQPLTVDI